MNFLLTFETEPFFVHTLYDDLFFLRAVIKDMSKDMKMKP